VVLQLAILLLSAAALAYEILLMRLLSIIHWQHFAAMILSLALLGYGASGTLLTLLRPWVLRRFPMLFTAGTILFAITAVASFAMAQRLPFNPLELPWHWRQLRILGLLYLLFAVPFLCAATSIGSAFVQAEGRIARLYRADLVGAGIGAVGMLLLLSFLSPAECLRVVASCGLLSAAAYLANARRIAAIVLAAIALAFPWFVPGQWPRLTISEFKPLAQTLRIPRAVVVEEHSSPLAFVSVVESKLVPFRFAPGLSLDYVGDLPEQVGIFSDAAALTVINRFDRSALEYLDHTTSSLPYHLPTARRSVLVVNAGGGNEVLSALQHGANRIDALELNRNIITVVRGRYAAYSGAIYSRPNVRLHSRQPRDFLSATNDRFDLIVDASSAATGIPLLVENYLYTVEGMRQMLDRLTAEGLLCLTRPVNLPPRDTLKLVATAVAALEDLGAAEPSSHLALIRGWDTATVLVKKSPFMPGDIAAVRAFAGSRSFDLAFYPGMRRADVNRFHILDEPFFYDGVLALTGPERRDFLSRYKFQLRPATDDRPYFGHFFKWSTFFELMRLRTRGGAPLLEVGYLVLIATVVQAAVAGIILVLLPLLIARRRAIRQQGSSLVVVCFAGLGLAFLFLEIIFIQKLILFLGHPLTAVATALAGFLVFGGIGSGLSPRFAGRWMARPIVAIGVLTILFTVAFPFVVGQIGSAAPWLKLATSMAMIAPLGFFMGMPFPIALAIAGARNPEWIPWAWSINGCASVISPVLATLIAVHAGYLVVSLAALAFYGLAALAIAALSAIDKAALAS
jgi:hypothetical protein